MHGIEMKIVLIYFLEPKLNILHKIKNHPTLDSTHHLCLSFAHTQCKILHKILSFVDEEENSPHMFICSRCDTCFALVMVKLGGRHYCVNSMRKQEMITIREAPC
jgi:hypothetical protein